MDPIPRFPRIVKRAHRVCNPHDIHLILNYLSQPLFPIGSLTQISLDTGIPEQTLSDWRQKRLNPATANWVPLAEGHPKKRSLSSHVEDALDGMFRENFIRLGVGATRKHMAELAKNAYASLSPEKMHTDRFCASARFVDQFLARHELGLRKPDPESRPRSRASIHGRPRKCQIPLSL
jgi:hypothetical protein